MNPKSIGQFIIIGLVAGGAYYFYGQVHGAATVNVTPRDPLLSGLVGHWTFDGPDMMQNVADASGQGNTGYLTLGASGYTATTTAIGKLGQALEFDGDNDSIDAGSSVSINSITNATVAVWVKPDSTSNFYSIISNARDCCGSYKGIELELYNTGKFRWVIWGTDSLPRNVFSLTSATAGLWQHVVGTYDGTSLKIYMNGEFEQSTAYTGSIGIPASYNLNIGEMGHSSSVWNFDGSLDDVRVYNRALSADEVAQLYNLGAAKMGVTPRDPLSSGLVGHWTFDGPDMTQNVADVTSGNHDGYLTGYAATTTAIGVVGQGLEFDGVNDYVDTKTTVSTFFNSSLGSISVWVRPTGTAAEASMYYDGQNAVGSSGVFAPFGIARANVSGEGDKLWAYNADTFGTFDVIGASYTVNEWTHLVWMHSGGYLYFYKDGTLVGQTPSGATRAMGNLLIGKVWKGSPGYYWQGSLDDVRVYNRALSASEVAQLYALGR